MIQQFEPIFFYILAAVAVFSAVGVALNRNAVYGALLLLVNFCVLAVFYVALGAQFLAMVQIAVYAGAIVVLFLFVEMLLGASGQAGLLELFSLRNLVAIAVAAVFLTFVGTIVFEVAINGAKGDAVTELLAEIGQTQAIGMTLFTDYFLAFQLAGVLLLVGMVGAIVLGRDWRKRIGGAAPAPDSSPHDEPEEEKQ